MYLCPISRISLRSHPFQEASVSSRRSKNTQFQMQRQSSLVAFIASLDRHVDTKCTIDVTHTFFTRRQIAERYPISQHTLAKLASSGRGPRFYKPIDRVLYRLEDIDAWIESSAVLPQAATNAERDPTRPQAMVKPKTGRGTYDRQRLNNDTLPPGRGRKSLTPSPKSALLRKD